MPDVFPEMAGVKAVRARSIVYGWDSWQATLPARCSLLHNFLFRQKLLISITDRSEIDCGFYLDLSSRTNSSKKIELCNKLSVCTAFYFGTI